MYKLRIPFKSTRSKIAIGAVIAAATVGTYVAVSFLSVGSVTVELSSNTVSSPSKQSETAKPLAAPKPPEATNSMGTMAEHKNIIATVFWVGEAADADNDYIQNRSSTWQEDWQGYYGGVDDPDKRCGHKPCSFAPKENPFYFALPFNDYQVTGQPRPANVLRKIPWYTAQPEEGASLLKNRWVKISNGDMTAYAQWEDAGPFNEDDVDYVFGDNAPTEHRAGIDLSPATAAYLRVDGRGLVTWQFVDEAHVPTGPWKEVITTSGIVY